MKQIHVARRKTVFLFTKVFTFSVSALFFGLLDRLSGRGGLGLLCFFSLHRCFLRLFFGKLYLGGNKLSQTARDAREAVKAKRSGLRVIF